MSRIAPKVLVVWFASWLLLVLQPCCETLAAMIPHGHDTGAETSALGHGDHHQGHDSTKQANTGHGDHNHGHDNTKQANTGHGDHNQGHDNNVYVEEGHQHCDDGTTLLSALPDVVFEKNRSGIFPEKPDAVINTAESKPVNQVSIYKAKYFPDHPPPSRQKTYLETLRLRI